jgi:hypothetical protein
VLDEKREDKFVRKITNREAHERIGEKRTLPNNILLEKRTGLDIS